MNSKERTVAEMRLFKGLKESQIKKIAEIASERTTRKGKIIFEENSPSEGFFVLTKGKVKIFKVSAEGKEKILHIFKEGEPFGEVPAFMGEPFYANAQMLENGAALFFSTRKFMDLLDEDHSLALNIIAVLCVRLKQFVAQIESLSLKEAAGRVASYFLYLSNKQENESVVELDVSKVQLANILGTTPETLSRTFAKMSRQGIIAVAGNEIRIADFANLKLLAEEGRLSKYLGL